MPIRPHRPRIGSNWFLRLMVAAVLASGLISNSASAASDSIEIAVLPYFSQRLLLEQYEPLRAFVEARLHRPTFLATAHDYRTFVQRTQRYEYSFIITGPHLGRLAQVDSGYRPLLGWKSKLQGVFLVKADSPFQKLADLRGLSICTPPPLAVTTMLGLDALASAGLGANDVKPVPQPSHNAAALSVLRGEHAAALVWTKHGHPRFSDPRTAPTDPLH